MKWSGSLGRQFSDLVAYLFLPLSCLLLPVRWGDRLLWRCARRGWVLRTRSGAALEAAKSIMFVAKPQQWQQRWRLVELTEARDTWFCLFGRAGGLLKRMRIDGDLPTLAAGHALLGLHYGPSILALKAFKEAGLRPRFVHRQVDNALKRPAPIQHFYLKLLVRVINSCCDHAAITVPGAKAELEQALSMPCTPVLLMDAPPTADRRVQRVRMMERPARLAADGIHLLTGKNVKCTFFVMALGDGPGDRILGFEPAPDYVDAGGLAAGIANHFDRWVLPDSAQWRLWHAAGQLLESDRTPDG